MAGLKLINRGRLDTPVLEEFEHLTQNLATFLAQIFDTEGNLIAPDQPAAHHATHEPGGRDALQLAAAARLFGRGSSGAGAVEEITLGTNLTMSGTTLAAASAGASTILEYRYATSTTPPPSNSQIELDAAHPFTAATHLYVHVSPTDGSDAYWALMLIAPGQVLNIQDKTDHTKYVSLTVTGAPIDNAGVYVDLPVSWRANGTAIANQAVVLMRIAAAGGIAAHHTTHEPGGSDALVNVAWTNVANTFTAPQTITGSVTASGSLYEQGRTTALGYWTHVPYNAANFGADGGAWTVTAGNVVRYAYTLFGKTMLVHFTFNATNVTATPTTLQLKLPFTPVSDTRVIVQVIDAGVQRYGVAVAIAGVDVLVFYATPNAAPWTPTAASNTYVFGQILVEIP